MCVNSIFNNYQVATGIETVYTLFPIGNTGKDLLYYISYQVAYNTIEEVDKLKIM